MMVRALICCAALILGLLATLGATAQSAGVCNGPGCRAVEKSRPLDLMAFMRGGAQTSGKATAKTGTAKSGKHRHGTSRPATRPAPDKAPAVAPDPTPDLTPDQASLPQQAALPVAAATAYAAHAENDVQVVTSDQVNTIDLAMLRNSPETVTVGATPKTHTDAGDRITSADAGQIHDQVVDQARSPAPGPSDAAASPSKGANHSDAALRDESWMGRIWSAVGDGFVALVAMVRQLFA